MMEAKLNIRVCGERLRYIGDTLHAEYGQMPDHWRRDMAVYLVKCCGVTRMYINMLNGFLTMTAWINTNTG